MSGHIVLFRRASRKLGITPRALSHHAGENAEWGALSGSGDGRRGFVPTAHLRHRLEVVIQRTADRPSLPLG
jgi:hypothetical protein